MKGRAKEMDTYMTRIVCVNLFHLLYLVGAHFPLDLEIKKSQIIVQPLMTLVMACRDTGPGA